MPTSFKLKLFSDDQALANWAARDWQTLRRESAGFHAAALSGGRIAKTFFASVANLAKESGETLNTIHFFWADERCLPPTDPESNFLPAQEGLFEPLGLPTENIHRLAGELPPAQAVSEANADIRRVVAVDSEGVPVLDIVFLGLGEDGHIASLMPNAPSEVLASRDPYVHVPNSPKPPPNRLSLTYPMLAAARNVWVLVGGAGKADALRESLAPEGQTPLARVLRSRMLTIVYALNTPSVRPS